MKPSDSFFPIQTETIDQAQDQKVIFKTKTEGGISYRDYVALEFAVALFSNPVIIQSGLSNTQTLDVAFKNADKFIEKAREHSNPPESLL